MNTFLKSALGLACSALIAASAMAVPITGSINFNGTPTLNNTNIALATQMTALTDLSVGAIHTLAYSAIPTNTTTVTWALPVTFSPPTVPAGNLWSVAFGGATYSFAATTMSSSFANGAWSIIGLGNASIVGTPTTYETTPGVYTISLTSAGTATFAFGSTATAVPDGGSIAMLFGLSILSLGVFSRRVKRA